MLLFLFFFFVPLSYFKIKRKNNRKSFKIRVCQTVPLNIFNTDIPIVRFDHERLFRIVVSDKHGTNWKNCRHDGQQKCGYWCSLMTYQGSVCQLVMVEFEFGTDKTKDTQSTDRISH